jgi:lipoate-protein ligase A
LSGASLRWRLLVDEPADGAWNMAFDEALLERYAMESLPAPTLRLYGWAPPALSLGRSQPAAGAHEAGFLRRSGIDLVRRPTGGLAVLHEDERTYAVVGRLDREPFGGGVVDNYRRIARALCAALSSVGVRAGPTAGGSVDPRRGPQACFGGGVAHEIAVRGRKLIGSAQLRRGKAFLQHGSILLRADGRRLARALGLEEPPSGFTDLERAAPRRVGPAELDAALIAAFERVFGSVLERAAPQRSEIERATRLRTEIYLSAGWTLHRRRAPARGSEAGAPLR